ncbi:hypothetical protein Tco_1347163 [Tanacetum coccineum]|uniref:Uncharacterized protein n=1 Tax=Tanacetum coccineum TaxID=301880 RepID=A0ABQ5D7C9_9ASTR
MLWASFHIAQNSGSIEMWGSGSQTVFSVSGFCSMWKVLSYRNFLWMVVIDWSDMEEEEIQGKLWLFMASQSNSQLNDKGFVDSGCSRHMTGNIAHLLDFKDFDGGYVTFGGGALGGRILA